MDTIHKLTTFTLSQLPFVSCFIGIAKKQELVRKKRYQGHISSNSQSQKDAKRKQECLKHLSLRFPQINTPTAVATQNAVLDTYAFQACSHTQSICMRYGNKKSLRWSHREDHLLIYAMRNKYYVWCSLCTNVRAVEAVPNVFATFTARRGRTSGCHLDDRRRKAVYEVGTATRILDLVNTSDIRALPHTSTSGRCKQAPSVRRRSSGSWEARFTHRGITIAESSHPVAFAVMHLSNAHKIATRRTIIPVQHAHVRRFGT